MNVTLRLDNSTPGKLIGPSGSWVKKHRALRNDEEQETGTIVPDTDYLEAMDQWLSVIDDHEALKTNSKEELESARKTQKARTLVLQAEMATRMRDRVRLAEEEDDALAAAAAAASAAEEDFEEIDDWPDSELGEETSRQLTEPPIQQFIDQPLHHQAPQPTNLSDFEQDPASLAPSTRVTPSVSSSSRRQLKRVRSATTTPILEGKKTRVDALMNISASIERSIGGLSSQIGKLVAGKPNTEQTERLRKVEDAIVKIEERSENDSKKLDALLQLLNTKQGQSS